MIRSVPARATATAVGACCAVLLLLVAPEPRAQDPAERARDATAEAVDVRQQTQQRQDAWSAEEAELNARFRAARDNVAWLEGRKADETARVAALQERVDELGRRLDEAVRLEDSLQDTLRVIFGRLEQSVDRSLPFLPAERARRLESLDEVLVQPDILAGEKLRRLLEALQVEAGYGASVEVYQDRIPVAGEEIHADILRLGRVALFWRTPDGGRFGAWDQGDGAWTELDGGHGRNLTLAFEMAMRRRPVELVDLPLGRIAP